MKPGDVHEAIATNESAHFEPLRVGNEARSA